MANRKNLANGVIQSPGIDNDDTSVVVGTGEGARFPATPFFATITPFGVLSTIDNSEIVSVTNVSSDTLTIVRAQKSTSAKSFVAGSIISNGIYTDDIDIGLETYGATGKTTPVDGDSLPLSDSAASNVLKKVTWANIKATLKTYFDTLYATVSHTHAFAALTSIPTTLAGYGITDAQPIDGWKAATGTWSYSSWTSGTRIGEITVPTDATTIYQAGMRIRISQSTGGTKYGIITKVASTTLTVFFPSGTTLNNESISTPFFSSEYAPFGFNTEQSLWTLSLTDTSLRTAGASGGTSVLKRIASLSLAVGIGIWDMHYSAAGQMNWNSSGYSLCGFALSNAADGASAPSHANLYTGGGAYQTASNDLGFPININGRVTLTSATTFYAVAASGNANNMFNVGNAHSPTVISATSAWI